MGVCSRHGDLAEASFCDGHTTVLRASVSIEILEALATKAGGEPINGEF